MLSFDARKQNPVEFLEQYQKCFNLITEVNRMKINLIKFVKPSFFEEFNLFLQENDYESCKLKFIELHISIYTTNKKKEVDLEFDPSNIEKFVRDKVKGIKKFITTDENIIVNLVLLSMPCEVSELFYSSTMCASVNDLFTYSLSLDRFKESDSEVNSAGDSPLNDDLNLSEPQASTSGVSLVNLAVLERANDDNLDPIFMRLNNDSDSSSESDDNARSINTSAVNLVIQKSQADSDGIVLNKSLDNVSSSPPRVDLINTSNKKDNQKKNRKNKRAFDDATLGVEPVELRKSKRNKKSSKN